MQKYRVLIVDDSIVFRTAIQTALKTIEQFEIAGIASHGRIAIEKLQQSKIDLMILDIEMPEMNGVETLAEMKRLGITTKVIVFSGASRIGADKTLAALNLGAIDFAMKPDSKVAPGQSPSEKVLEALTPKIDIFLKSMKTAAPLQKMPTQSASAVGNSPSFPKIVWSNFLPEILVIASSTGGPSALDAFFQNFKEPVPFPIVIAQHMPPVFTQSLAQRLADVSGRKGAEAIQGEVLRPNQIYIAPGGYHLRVTGLASLPVATLDQGPNRNSVRPAADHLFESAAQTFGARTLGVVLTGMGADGKDGSRAIKRAGGAVLIQNKETCAVYGMPGEVAACGAFDEAGSPEDIAMKIIRLPRLKGLLRVA